jgi:SAM-dependent methyltransferase
MPERAALYDRIGITYSTSRKPDPRLAAAIRAALGDARSVVNVGAGTGQYEPSGLDVIAVEPSQVMIAQRPPGSARVIRGAAEALPLEDDSVDAAMAIATT